MASETFFQACQEGNVENLIEQIESTEGLDINSKDGYGMSALAYAARNGHVEVVRQLLSRDAERAEVLEQGYGRSNPEIAQLLEEGGEGRGMAMGGQEDVEDGIHQAIPSHQMQDGGVYMNGVSHQQHGYPMMPGYGVPPQGQQYFYDGMQTPNGSGRRLSQQQGHMRKDSNVNLPPPEIARLIPCRFFPNCKYGDKCLFAHPIMNMSGAPQSPLSPSMSQPPMQPIFYQQVPSGYPYPGPYGAGPHQPFYAPMGPPNPQYGLPAHFSQSMIQSHPQQHMHMGPNQHSTSSSEAAPITDSESQNRTPALAADQVAQADTISPSAPAPQESVSLVDSDKLAPSSPQQGTEELSSQLDNGRVLTATPPQQDEVAPLDSQNPEEDKGAKDKADEAEQGSQDAQGKPIHRRQSFNSFLHHHAIPFQPTLQPGADVGMMGTMQPYPPQRMGPKNRRMPGMGPNGFVGSGRRMNGDRPACTFFAGGKCRFGDECRFPHILPDGTDARPMQAQQRQMYAAQFGGANAAMRNGASNGASGNVNNSVPASTPSGPQAEKKAAAEKQQQQQAQHEPQQAQQVQQPQNGKASSPSPSLATTNGAGSGPAPVVRSNPSKTSTQAAAAGSSTRGGQGGNSNKKQHSSQPAQRIPTVNDFPALAISSPNLSGPTASAPISPSLQAQAPLAAVAATTSSSGNEASSCPSLNGSSAPAKANFSAILSAPAPAKPRLSAEASTSAKSTGTTEEGEAKEFSDSVEGAKLNGDEKSKPVAKGNGGKDAKARAKEAKAGKTDSYKNVAAKPASNVNGVPSEDDDFQLVNRSRASNKRGPSNSTSSDGFATQAKAVTA